MAVLLAERHISGENTSCTSQIIRDGADYILILSQNGDLRHETDAEIIPETAALLLMNDWRRADPTATVRFPNVPIDY